jgi:hypothetical protein
MNTIMPKGESIRQAVKWISEKRSEHGARPLSALIEEAALRFNLSPKEEMFLRTNFSETQKEQ